MLQVEAVGGGRALIQGLDQASDQVRAAVGEGIAKAISEIAADVATHTPSRSGTARASVDGHMTSPTSGVVLHEWREAFYMRFVIGGAKSHLIFPKYGTDRGLKQAIKRRLKKGESIEGIKRRKSLAFSAGGGDKVFAAHVLHPGVTASHLMRNRLEANRLRIGQTLRESIVNRLSPDDWIRYNEMTNPTRIQ